MFHNIFCFFETCTAIIAIEEMRITKLDGFIWVKKLTLLLDNKIYDDGNDNATTTAANASDDDENQGNDRASETNDTMLKTFEDPLDCL